MYIGVCYINWRCYIYIGVVIYILVLSYILVFVAYIYWCLLYINDAVNRVQWHLCNSYLQELR